MARTAVKTDPDGASTVTVKQLHDFQRGHRRDLTRSNAANDGIKHLIESSYTVPPDGTEARELYKSENQYFYNVLQNCVKGCQGLIYIRKHKLTLDG
eukprot:1368380-Ditylum_brightwellii.AAC.1